jgi:Arc/MetJ family transcription regulator
LLHTLQCVIICTEREGSLATNLAIDDKLIDEARRIGQHKTKKEAVTAALDEYVRRRRQLEILDHFGTIDFDPDYDYKKIRMLDRIEVDED